MLRLVLKGVQSKIVVIFYYFGPLTLRHPFQCSPKVLKDELLFIIGIVVAIAVRAEPLHSNRFCIVRISLRSWTRVSLGNMSVKIGSSSLQTLPSTSSHDTFIILQLITPSLISKRIAASPILLSVLVIFLGCSFRDCALRRRGLVLPRFCFALRFLFACPSERPSRIYDHNVSGLKVWTWN